MSQWTHVNAAIRFDGEPITKKELGVICTYQKWKDTDMILIINHGLT
jgi:hypothetical protein